MEENPGSTDIKGSWLLTSAEPEPRFHPFCLRAVLHSREREPGMAQAEAYQC